MKSAFIVLPQVLCAGAVGAFIGSISGIITPRRQGTGVR